VKSTLIHDKIQCWPRTSKHRRQERDSSCYKGSTPNWKNFQLIDCFRSSMLQKTQSYSLTAQQVIADTLWTLAQAYFGTDASLIKNGLLSIYKFFLDMVAQFERKRTKAVRRRRNHRDPDTSFQSSRSTHARIQKKHPRRYSAWNFRRTSWTPISSKIMGWDDLRPIAESVRNFRVKTFLANLDPQHRVSPMGISLECRPCQDSS